MVGNRDDLGMGKGKENKKSEDLDSDTFSLVKVELNEGHSVTLVLGHLMIPRGGKPILYLWASLSCYF